MKYELPSKPPLELPTLDGKFFRSPGDAAVAGLAFALVAVWAFGLAYGLGRLIGWLVS